MICEGPHIELHYFANIAQVDEERARLSAIQGRREIECPRSALLLECLEFPLQESAPNTLRPKE